MNNKRKKKNESHVSVFRNEKLTFRWHSTFTASVHVLCSSSMAFDGEEEALARQRKDRTVGLKMSWLARRNHLGFPSLGLFHSHNFRHVISYMLNNTPPRYRPTSMVALSVLFKSGI